MKRYKFPSKNKNFFIHYTSGPYLERHCHNYWEFSIITRGKVLHKIGSLERIVDENTLLVIRPDDAHSLHNATEQEIACVNVGVREEVLKNILSALSPDLYESLLEGPYQELKISKSSTIYFVNMFNKIHTTINDEHASDDLLATIFISVVRELLSFNHKAKQSKNYSPTVNEFIEYMRKPENLTLSITDIIKNMNYSHCHIIRLFKKETGTTPSQYFLKIKLNFARNLLETTNLSVLDIASTVGFSSLGHFTEVFKKQYSLPPANYRRKWNIYFDSFDEITDNN